MMNQFECWRMNGQRVIVAAVGEHYDFMMGFWRIMRVLYDDGEGAIRTL